MGFGTAGCPGSRPRHTPPDGQRQGNAKTVASQPAVTNRPACGQAVRIDAGHPSSATPFKPTLQSRSTGLDPPSSQIGSAVKWNRIRRQVRSDSPSTEIGFAVNCGRTLQSANGDQAVGGRWVSGSETRTGARRTVNGKPHRDCGKAERNQEVYRAVSSLGRGAHLRLDVTVSATGQGLRADTCQLVGVGTPGCLPVLDTAGGTRRNPIKSQNLRVSMT